MMWLPNSLEEFGKDWFRSLSFIRVNLKVAHYVKATILLKFSWTQGLIITVEIILRQQSLYAMDCCATENPDPVRKKLTVPQRNLLSLPLISPKVCTTQQHLSRNAGTEPAGLAECGPLAPAIQT